MSHQCEFCLVGARYDEQGNKSESYTNLWTEENPAVTLGLTKEPHPVAIGRAWRVQLPTVLASVVLACSSDSRSDSSTDKYRPGSAREVLGVPRGIVRGAIAARLDSGETPSWVSRNDWIRVRRVYTTFDNAPLWLEPRGLKDRASALLEALRDAEDHALNTAAYPLDSVRRVVETDGGNAPPQALADADVLLTAAYVAYATDMLIGQIDPKTVSQAWHIHSRQPEVDSALVRTLQTFSMKDGLAAMVPQDSAYNMLKQEYERYRRIASSNGWSTLVKAPNASQLAARLGAEGYAVDSTRTSVEQGIRLFQERHGLPVNGRADKATIDALNVPAIERVHQIASNLERHRWLPRTLGTRYIYVNVPAFHLEAYDSGQKKLEMKIVVGAEYDGRATPVFSDSMEFVVFRPYWNVPPRIAEKEYFPKYGTSLPEGFETWTENGELRIRQRPGEKNALGLVKFMFPNNFNIYLHDTPEKALFNRTDRAASHGCIRLEKPTELAEFVLDWSVDSVLGAMHGSPNRTVKLPRKIPVYVVYFTTFVRHGELYFADDLYGRDRPMDAKIDTTRSPRPTSSLD